MFEYPVFWFRSSRNVVRMGPFCMLAAHIIICNIEQISPRVFVFFSTSTSIVMPHDGCQICCLVSY
jgi:hypothetical protein